jgi:hypothetical protein
MLQIRILIIFTKSDLDPHRSEKQDPDLKKLKPDKDTVRIKVKSRAMWMLTIDDRSTKIHPGVLGLTIKLRRGGSELMEP